MVLGSWFLLRKITSTRNGKRNTEEHNWAPGHQRVRSYFRQVEVLSDLEQCANLREAALSCYVQYWILIHSFVRIVCSSWPINPLFRHLINPFKSFPLQILSFCQLDLHFYYTTRCLLLALHFTLTNIFMSSNNFHSVLDKLFLLVRNISLGNSSSLG